MARVHRLARRKGVNLEAAMATLVQELSDDELESVTAEYEQVLFGSDTAARDAARREVLRAAGYPDWTNEAAQERAGRG